MLPSHIILCSVCPPTSTRCHNLQDLNYHCTFGLTNNLNTGNLQLCSGRQQHDNCQANIAKAIVHGIGFTCTTPDQVTFISCETTLIIRYYCLPWYSQYFSAAQKSSWHACKLCLNSFYAEHWRCEAAQGWFSSLTSSTCSLLQYVVWVFRYVETVSSFFNLITPDDFVPAIKITQWTPIFKMLNSLLAAIPSYMPPLLQSHWAQLAISLSPSPHCTVIMLLLLLNSTNNIIHSSGLVSLYILSVPLAWKCIYWYNDMPCINDKWSRLQDIWGMICPKTDSGTHITSELVEPSINQAGLR